jgi:hypothetical protein
MPNEPNFMGRDGFLWFHGVVEDRMDPDQLGRVKVRILGCHTKDKSYIATEDLQWAYVMMPITSASMNGIGESPIGVVPGSWVLGFFRDGSAMQEPCIIGTLGGIPQDGPNKGEGFNDPRDSSGTTETLASSPRHIASRSYPKDGSGAKLTNDTKGPVYPNILNEPDTNRIARNSNTSSTILQIIRNIIDTNVPISFSGSWNEPGIWYNGKYPYVHVLESESGHIKVTDDTPNSEGELSFNRTGTFEQIQTDGTKITKIVGDGYTIVMRGNHVHVMNNENERFDKEYNVSVGGRWNVEVSGNINILCHGSLYAKVNGEADITVGGSAKIKAQDVSLTTIKLDIKSAGPIAIDAPKVDINMGTAAPKVPVEPKK